MRKITPDDRLKIVGLFLLNDELTQQQQGIMRSLTKMLDPAASYDAVPVNDHIADAVYSGDTNYVQDRVDTLLKKMQVIVEIPVPVIAGENFYSMRHLELARLWWHKFAADETLETHYLSVELMRIPAFLNWITLLNSVDARELYDREDMLQYHKDDIVLRALEGGLYWE